MTRCKDVYTELFGSYLRPESPCLCFVGSRIPFQCLPGHCVVVHFPTADHRVRLEEGAPRFGSLETPFLPPVGQQGFRVHFRAPPTPLPELDPPSPGCPFRSGRSLRPGDWGSFPRRVCGLRGPHPARKAQVPCRTVSGARPCLPSSTPTTDPRSPSPLRALRFPLAPRLGSPRRPLHPKPPRPCPGLWGNPAVWGRTYAPVCRATPSDRRIRRRALPSTL